MKKAKNFAKFNNQQLDTDACKQVKGGYIHFKSSDIVATIDAPRDWNDIVIRNDDPSTGRANKFRFKFNLFNRIR